MAQGRIRNRAGSATEDWRERPISADDIHRAQVLEHVYVPQEAAWQMWADDFLSVPASAVRAPLAQLFVPADDPWPALPYAGAARAPGLSTAQNAGHALVRERHVRASGVTLGLARLLIGMLGIPSRCERPGCNRAAACTGERRGWQWCSYPGPAWPPCVHSAGRADILRPTVERLIDRLDALIEARLTARLGQPWAAVEAMGLTHLPEEEFHAPLKAMVEESQMRANLRGGAQRRPPAPRPALSSSRPTGVLAAETDLPALTVKANAARTMGTASHAIEVARADPSVPCPAGLDMAPAAGRCTARHVDPFAGPQTADDPVVGTGTRTNTHTGHRDGPCGFSRQDGYAKRGKDKSGQRTQTPDVHRFPPVWPCEKQAADHAVGAMPPIGCLNPHYSPSLRNQLARNPAGRLCVSLCPTSPGNETWRSAAGF